MPAHPVFAALAETYACFTCAPALSTAAGIEKSPSISCARA